MKPALNVGALFDVLVRLRAANADALLTLFFDVHRVPRRTAMRRLSELVRDGFLGHLRLEGTRCVYHLTAKGLAASSTAARAKDWIRRPPAPRQADYCWLRSSLIAALTRDGWNVGRSWLHQHHLHAHLIAGIGAKLDQVGRSAPHAMRATYEGIRKDDGLTPMWRSSCAACRWRGDPRVAVAKCGRCGGATTNVYTQAFFRCTGCPFVADEVRSHRDQDGACCFARMRECDPLPFDVAFRHGEVMILFIDKPSRPVERQIRELPLFWIDQPRVSIVVRSADADSRFDSASKAWVTMGARHRALLHAFSPKGYFSFLRDRMTLIDYRPEIQLRFAR